MAGVRTRAQARDQAAMPWRTPVWDIAEADVDDLIVRAGEAGGEVEVGELRAVRDVLFGGLPPAPVDLRGARWLLIIHALRYEGRALTWLLCHFGRPAADTVRHNSRALAEFLGRAEAWTTDRISQFLVGRGVPPDRAAEIAGPLMALAG